MSEPTNRWDFLIVVAICMTAVITFSWEYFVMAGTPDVSEVKDVAPPGAISVMLFMLYRKFVSK